MDLATMLAMLLFTDGTTEHYVQAERNMGACMSVLGGKKISRRPASAEIDYVVYRLCLPASPRLFNRASPSLIRWIITSLAAPSNSGFRRKRNSADARRDAWAAVVAAFRECRGRGIR